MSYRASAIAATFINIVLIGYGTAHAADPIQCKCKFAQTSGYTGVGTRAACSAYTLADKTCTIAFGGTGYDEPQISRLKLDPRKYRAVAYEITVTNLGALLDRNPAKIATSQYLRSAIPMYMRAVYLRSDVGLDDGTLNDLDKQVVDISSEYAEQIASVFVGKQKPFEAAWREKHRLFVERGAIRFTYAERIDLVAVFFDPKDL